MLNEYRFGDIYIRYAIDEQPDDTMFPMHIHEQCEIYFFIAGNVEYLVEGSNYPLNESCLIIMRSAEVHKAKIIGTERYERYAINFPLSFVKSIDPEGVLTKSFIERPLGTNNLFQTPELDTTLVHKLFAEMFLYDDDYMKQLTIKTHLLLLLDMIHRAFSEQHYIDITPTTTSERIVRYVNDHIFDDISVPVLAKQFYLSSSQFSRIFKQATGASPWEYITKKRLTAAKEKIRNGFSIQQASESCGFKDYSSFYRAYTKHFGMAPKEDVGK